MAPAAPPAFRIADPASLIDAVPYLIGFHPAESLVLTGMAGHDGRRTVQATLRVDLPRYGAAADNMAALFAALNRAGSTSAAAVIITGSADADPRQTPRWRELTTALSDTATAIGTELVDALFTTPDRWWSMLCQNPDCCPAQGHPRTSGTSPAAAEAVLSGIAPMKTRDDVEAILTPAQDRRRLDPALAAAEHRISQAPLADQPRRVRASDATALLRAANQRRGTAAPLTDRQLARFGVALTDTATRDQIWLAIDEESVAAEALLLDLLHRLPAPYDAAPLFLYGWAQWRAGNGTLAAMAAEHALASDPSYTAARLLLTAVRNGLDPRTTPALREPTAGR